MDGHANQETLLFKSFARSSLIRATCAVLALATSVGAAAQSYPDKPVKVVVGFAPGGTNDVLARLFATRLQDRLKQSFVVDNKPGAASMIAAELVVKAPPDGATLFVASSGAMTINPALYPKISYDPIGDFAPVALLGSFPLVVTVNASSPVKSLRDLTAASKSAAGGSLDHGVGSSTFQLAAELFAREAKLKFNHIPYKGSGPTVTALLGGEIAVAVLDVAAVLPQIKAGKLRALAVTTAARSSVLPDVPTVAESGFAGYDVAIWTGLVTPKGVTAEVQNKLRATVKDILAEKDTREKIEALGMEPGSVDGGAFAKLIASDLAKWTAVAKSANIKVE